MRIARFRSGETISYGIVDEDDVVVLRGDPLFSGFEPTGERVPIAAATLLAPVIPRSKVVAVGRNYADHAAESGSVPPAEPLLFLKPNTAVIGPEDPILLPAQSQRVDFEGELAVVVGRVTRDVSEGEALGHVFGYTVANDVTARDLQASDGQWTRAKGFDSFCPLGPVIETEFDPASFTLRTRLNGELRQEATGDAMVHSVPAIIAYASSVFTLLPGDVILTGTPAGVGPMAEGDRVAVEIDGIGVLENPVRRR